jgi:ATP-dependent helicase HrpA
MRVATRTLLLADLPSGLKSVLGSVSTSGRLTLSHNPAGGIDSLADDMRGAAIDVLVARAGGVVWTPAEYTTLRAKVAAGLTAELHRMTPVLVDVLNEWRAARDVVGKTPAAVRPTLEAHLDSLVFSGFVTVLGAERMSSLVRYLSATVVRAQNYAANPGRDAINEDIVSDVEAEYQDMLDSLPAERRDAAAVTDIRWMIEELRVSLFAQKVGTAYPISEKRVRTAIAAAAS